IYAKLTSALALSQNYEEAVEYAQAYNQHISEILSVGEQYKAENDEVIFADIIREYEHFNQVIPWYEKPWAVSSLFALIALVVYGGSTWYYRSKMSTKVSKTMSELQVEFQNIKLD
ncbi:MAG: hypothetical protein AAGA85_10880, partial [Bacteroidota bacterium]